jgi:hypothetical protein
VAQVMPSTGSTISGSGAADGEVVGELVVIGMGLAGRSSDTMGEYPLRVNPQASAARLAACGS